MPPTRRLILPLLVLLTPVFAVGCEDDPTGPDAFIVAAETEAALHLVTDLPTFPTLVAGALAEGKTDGGVRGGAALADARALWIEAEGEGDPAVAVALRASAYELAAPYLAAQLDASELAALHGRLERWIGVAAGVLGGTVFPEIGAAIAEARALLVRARAAASAGDTVAAVRATLDAADRLGTTTPGGVALRLVREADALLDLRLSDVGAGDGAGPEETGLALERAERLLRGARDALARGEHVLAIRRAYYARQLLRQT